MIDQRNLPYLRLWFHHPDTDTKIVIATDHEAEPSETNSKLVEFSRNSDLFIHDAQYADAEYTHRQG